MLHQDMSELINPLFATYVFPTGRRMFAMREVERRARTRGLETVADHAKVSLAHDRDLLRIEGQYAPTHGFKYGPDARARDLVVDRILAALDGYLDSQVRIFGREHERGAAAATLRQRFFPQGMNSVIRLSFVEEHNYVNELVASIDEPEVSAALDALPELNAMLDELRTANTSYGAALSAEDTRPTSAEVREGQAHGQRLLAEVISMIVAHVAVQADDDVELLEQLLEPIYVQQGEIAASHRRRRRPGDVDPDTGAALPGDDDAASDTPDDGARAGDALGRVAAPAAGDVPTAGPII